ncbi:uncharacterized protein [Miscanthus floridulus]|uniref:uncharacterized protein n=1 Tax=Miscanthus floridulus TaxID=154761 RepID=UPI00345B1342
MALQHASPASSTLTTGSHGRSSAAVLRRPPTDSSSRLRVHAQSQKPTAGSRGGAGAETTATSSSPSRRTPSSRPPGTAPSSSASPASLFRPAPSSSSSPEGDAGGAGDVEGGAAAALDGAGVVEAVKADFARSYSVIGDLTLRAYEEDCEFADPAGSFRGLRHQFWVSAREIEHEAHQMGGPVIGGQVYRALAFQVRHVVPVEAYLVSNRVHGILLRC